MPPPTHKYSTSTDARSLRPPQTTSPSPDVRTVRPYRHQPHLPALAQFSTIDRKAGDYPFQNPYLYCAANPIIFIDPTGMAVIITGTNQDSAIEELQKAVGDCMTLSIDDAGKLCYKVEDGKTLSDNATSMKEYIDNESITVHYNNVDGFKTSEGQNMFGGAYMGNKISDDKKTVDAYQEVNTTVLSKISDAHGKPGADAFHELSEAVEGAKIALKSGKSSPKAGDNSSTYEEAHAKAYPQSGPVYFKGYDEKGNEIINPLSPENITKVRRAEWFINNIKGDKVILRKL